MHPLNARDINALTRMLVTLETHGSLSHELGEARVLALRKAITLALKAGKGARV